MKQAIAFVLSGVACFAFAMQCQSLAAMAGLLWSGISLALVGLAYVVRSPRVFGKREDGSIAWSATVLLLPFLLVQWVTWRVYTLLSREPAWHEIEPGLWLGRRASRRELPKGVEVVVDLTEAFPKPRGYDGLDYVALPTLDACPPPREATVALVRRLASCERGLYIHCAQGHGRSALLVALLLVARGEVHGLEEAMAQLKAMRPGAGLSRAQRAFAEALVEELRGAMPSS
jgi:protein-tyrosine phosphatase